MHYITKIEGELRPVKPLHAFVVREDATRYTSSGTSIPPEEARARAIAQQAVRWIAFATERTRMRPATITQKGVESACYSVLKRASSLAIPSKLAGVGTSQRILWEMVRSRVPVWTPLDLDPGEKHIVVLHDGEVIGHVQPKLQGWLRALVPFGARLYLSRITGSERSGYTLGVNVVVGHTGEALDKLLDALGDAGFGNVGGDGLGADAAPSVDSQTGNGPTGDGAAGHLRLVTPAASVQPEADPDDVVLYRDVRGNAHATVQHVVRRSPTGIEWGYGGSGPADLARSILLRFCDEATADALYVRFKDEVVATIPKAGGVLRAADIRAWLAARGVAIQR